MARQRSREEGREGEGVRDIEWECKRGSGRD